MFEIQPLTEGNVAAICYYCSTNVTRPAKLLFACITMNLCVSIYKASIDGGRCSNAFKIDKIQFSHTFFWFFVFNAAMKLERIILGISSWDTLLSSIDKKGEQKMHVAVAALKAEFSWPSLSFVVRHSKKCLTHLELLRELDEGGALTTTSSK